MSIKCPLYPRKRTLVERVSVENKTPALSCAITAHRRLPVSMGEGTRQAINDQATQ
jgi:hypothetical protein